MAAHAEGTIYSRLAPMNDHVLLILSVPLVELIPEILRTQLVPDHHRDHPDIFDAFMHLLASLELLKAPEQELADEFIALHDSTARQLEDDQFRLVLWLPVDEESLEDRTLALSHWCTGFLAALGSSDDPSAQGA